MLGDGPPPLPPPPRKILVKSSLFWLISEQDGRPLAEPPQGWSRSTDQNASRPRPLLAAQLTRVEALALLKTSAELSFCPIIGVTPMLAKLSPGQSARAWGKHSTLS